MRAPTTQKQQVRQLLKSIETGDPAPVGSINPQKYIQHNVGAADGLAGFGALMAQLPKGSARVNTVRVFQDHDLVFSHTDYNFFGTKIGFDIFRDRKSTRLNSSHGYISYAVFCLKKKKN